jgi:zinc/manganese transport system substrate-binding protein
VPEDRRKAITGHNSFHYFARAYGVTFESPRGYNTDSEPSARDMANLIRQVREQKIKALFIENMTNPVLVDEIARDSGAAVGPRLYSDALSKPGGPAPTYEAMMRHNVTALVAGMSKN